MKLEDLLENQIRLRSTSSLESGLVTCSNWHWQRLNWLRRCVWARDGWCSERVRLVSMIGTSSSRQLKGKKSSFSYRYRRLELRPFPALFEKEKQIKRRIRAFSSSNSFTVGGDGRSETGAVSDVLHNSLGGKFVQNGFLILHQLTIYLS